jgi:hypothetical protein
MLGERLRSRVSWRRPGLLLLPMLLALVGCQAVVTSPITSQVRLIAASPDAPGLDLYLNDRVLAYDLGFGSITSYIAVNAGTHTVAANTVGTKQAVIATKTTFVNSSQYTVLLGDVTANLQAMVLKDQTQPAPTGQIALRCIDRATKMGALDIYLVPVGQKVTAVMPLLTDLTIGSAPSYLNVPMGTYTLVVVPTGTVPTGASGPTYVGAQVTYAGGSATTMVLLDQQLATTPGVQVITATDYLSPGATK